MKQWKRLAALSSAIVMAAATLTYFPSDTLQNIRLEISASADETGAETMTEPQVWIEDNLTWTLDADGKLTISGTRAMKDYSSSEGNQSPVRKNSNVKKVVIEDGVTSIGSYAFASCNNLTSITISDSVTSIGNRAFVSCTSLTSITIPNSVTSIGAYAFRNCSSLKTISLSCKSTLKKSDFGKQANLVSYTPHTLTKTEAKAATCTKDGNKEYWTCEHCGKYFLSDDTNPETATAVELSETVISASHKLRACVHSKKVV